MFGESIIFLVKNGVEVTCFFLRVGRFRGDASKMEKSEIRSFSSSGRFCGVENGFIGVSVKNDAEKSGHQLCSSFQSRERDGDA